MKKRLKLVTTAGKLKNMLGVIDDMIKPELSKPPVCPRCKCGNEPLSDGHRGICHNNWHNYNLNPPDFKPTFKGL